MANEYGRVLPEWIIEAPLKNAQLFNELASQLDEGEASSIALALESENCQLILNDGAGRKMAERLGLTFIGTIGLGIEAKRRGLFSSVKPYIEQLRQVGFRFSEQVEQNALRQAGEL